MIWNVDPVLVSFAGIQIHWYGALFALSIATGFQIMKRIYAKEDHSYDELDSLLIYSVAGIIIGARLGHCFFYDPEYYLNNPLKILAIWEGGLASHGGGLGVIIAVFLYAKKYKVNYLWVLDRLAIPTALFGFFIRLANFINSEILGIPSNVYWAVTFKRIDSVPRHPVQLYEAFSYLAIFIALCAIYRASRLRNYSGALLGLFLSTVFSTRFLLEFVKEKQATYTSELIITTGQMLSIPFLVVGVFWLWVFIY